MLRKILFPLILGLSGVAVLLWLGLWQLQRLEWKQGILADLEARLAAAPVLLDLAATKGNDAYRPVMLSGTPTGQELHVLVSGTAAGTGYRVISGFATEGGPVIMVDQGLLALDNKDAAPLIQPMQITGTLIWPDDQNSSTPDPDLGRNIWFARNVDTMAPALEALPLMIVADATPDPRLTPLPVGTAGIKNDHWEYAVTWFLLALVWAAMTGTLIFRTLRQKDS